MIYFSLHPSIYAAPYNDLVIILDSGNNKYSSLVGPAAQYLFFILENTFTYKEGKYQTQTPSKKAYDSEELEYWIEHFFERNFIVEGSSPIRKTMASLPLKSGGLIEYQWDFKVGWKPFALASKREVIKAFFQLARVHRLIKKKKIDQLLNEFTKSSLQKQFCKSTQDEIHKLAAAVDAASLLYPKKTFCLAWAATFTILALKKNWSCNFVIGIQANPFYAHAWAEVEGIVVNDDPVIADVLSIILKEPFHPETALPSNCRF